MSALSRFLLACLVSSGCWIACEVSGGLLFLSFGLRLWRYEISPLFFEITSPVVWALAALLIAPLSLAFDRAFGMPARRRRTAWRLLFLGVTGPVAEVLLNEFVFRGVIGRPLYAYLFLPTFGGSGSLLSPLYYATLALHYPLTDRLLRRPGID